ncbi:MAG: hypothetical protein SH809_12960 [Rhodothermales bacterium]|nr:hypothetical protein [Rhodothermales bacterium]
MNNGIPPFRPTGPDFDQRPASRTGADSEPDAADVARGATSAPEPAPPTARTRPADAADAAFGAALDGALDRAAGTDHAADLTPDEQQMILRYFPEAPGLALRLYDQTSASRKVDPGAIGARVDLRG